MAEVAANVAHMATPDVEEKTAHTQGESGLGGSRLVEFKEGGYGWVVVFSVFMVNFNTWGLNSSYAVFLAYYLSTVRFPDATPLTFAFVGGLSVAIALLVSPLATVLVRLVGTRWTLRVGVVFETASFVAASFASRVWHLLLSQGVCFGVGMGFCFISTVGIVPQWFSRRRSLANAVATAGSGFGGLTYALSAQAMIAQLGLAWAFRILAVITFVANGGCSFLLRDRNAEVGAVYAAFRRELFGRLEFWLFMGWGFFCLVSYVIAVFSLADYAQQMGFSAHQASIVAALFNLSQGVGRPLIGVASDRYGRINAAGLCTFVAGLAAYLLWIPAGQYRAGLIVYALFGAFSGCLWPAVSPVGAEVVGLSVLPSALSVYWLVLVIPAAFAEAIGLSLRNPGRDGYLHVQILTGTCFMVAFVLIWLLRSWKLNEMERSKIADKSERNGHEAGGSPNTGDIPAYDKPNILYSYIKGMTRMQHV